MKRHVKIVTGKAAPGIGESDIPANADRRTFLMRSAVISATMVITNQPLSAAAQVAAATASPSIITPQLPQIAMRHDQR